MTPPAYFATVREEPFLVAYWRQNDVTSNIDMDDYGSRADLKGTYTNRTLASALIQDDPGAGSSIFATGGYAQVGDVAQLRITGDLSLEAWYAPSAYTFAGLVAKEASGYAAPYAMRLVNGEIAFALGNGASEVSIKTLGAPPLTLPTHVVATSFRGAMSIYVNGALVQTGTLGGQSVVDGGQPLLIGSGLSGLISEVAVYNGALSARRILRHFVLGQQILPDPSHYRSVSPPVMA